jgi:transcriptional activator of cad operon
MEHPATKMLRIGAWCIDPASGQISRDGESARLEARAMRLLLCLAERAGEVVSIDDLLSQAWSDVIVSPDSVYQAVASLRRVLGDDPRQPTYIATVPRRGYRMVATVSPWAREPVAQTVVPHASESEHTSPPTADRPTRRLRPGAGVTWAVGAALCFALLLAVLFLGTVATNNHPASSVVAQEPQKSIAVLPFLDLTEGMNQEPFADGMTVELIDRLSKVPGLRVHAPTPSARSHGKPTTITDMAKMLGVAYVVDGSVRKSGARLRIAARLIRADDESVVWADTYDRAADDILMVQDDIAGKVAKALTASIEARPSTSSFGCGPQIDSFTANSRTLPRSMIRNADQ